MILSKRSVILKEIDISLKICILINMFYLEVENIRFFLSRKKHYINAIITVKFTNYGKPSQKDSCHFIPAGYLSLFICLYV